jgi:diacylglycerol kinase family enzyme
MQTIQRFFVVMNAGSGRRGAQLRKQTVERELAACGAEAVVRLVRSPKALPEAIDWAIGMARERDGAVVAAGGDGTINAVVQQVLGTGLPFGALPQGTFNFFGRNHGLSEDLAQAARDLAVAVPQPVQVGQVNDRVFLINASLGLYRRLLQDREAFKARLGRSRLVAMWAGLNTLLRPHPKLELCIRGEAGETRETVSTLVVGNNRLQLERMGLADAACVERGHLLGVRLRPLGRLALLAVALRGVFGRWIDGDHGEATVFDELVVNPLPAQRRSLRVALDGEIQRLRPPLVFRVAPESLPLLRPPDAAERGR